MNASNRVRAWARQGTLRVRDAALPVLEAALAGAIAYRVAQLLLGHERPFFAPVAAWVALGASRDRQPRRVAEIAVGVGLGVGLGDLVVHLIGSGWWQMALVLVPSALAARFVDRSAVLTTQAGVQAIVVVGLPGITGGPFGRWTDAAIGGLAALALTVLMPSDLRRRPRRLVAGAAGEVAAALHEVARGLERGDEGLMSAALVRGRASQPALDGALEAARSALDVARLNPTAHRHLDEIGAGVEVAVLLDRAMRNTRVVARRAAPLVADGATFPQVAELVAEVTRAVEELAAALASGRPPVRARTDLTAACARADPYALADAGWQAQSLVLLVRSLLVDLLQAAGVGEEQARAVLPDL